MLSTWASKNLASGKGFPCCGSAPSMPSSIISLALRFLCFCNQFLSYSRWGGLLLLSSAYQQGFQWRSLMGYFPLGAHFATPKSVCGLLFCFQNTLPMAVPAPSLALSQGLPAQLFTGWSWVYEQITAHQICQCILCQTSVSMTSHIKEPYSLYKHTDVRKGSWALPLFLFSALRVDGILCPRWSRQEKPSLFNLRCLKSYGASRVFLEPHPSLDTDHHTCFFSLHILSNLSVETGAYPENLAKIIHEDDYAKQQIFSVIETAL